MLDDGFALFEDAVPPSLLATWRSIADGLEARALDGYACGRPEAGACVVETADGPSLIRFDDLHGTEPDAVLDLLACPTMIAIARELCGRGAVPLQVDLVYKQRGPESVIQWHQGAPHPRSYPYLNVGIYLDDADSGDGCLRFVPGTQHDLHDIGAMTAAHEWAPPGVVEQPAAAGDILVQDMMILHGSPARTSNQVRRTIYVEIRPTAGIAESGLQSAEWAALRERFMALVVRRSAGSGWPSDWAADLPTDLEAESDEAAAIVAHHEPPIPAVYAVHPPVPEPTLGSDRRPARPDFPGHRMQD